MNSDKTILMTIDVEDWFQVENFRPWIPFDTWDQLELRVERNVHRLLNLFDKIELKADQDHCSQITAENQKRTGYEPSVRSDEPKNSKKIRATFFVLGWIAEKLPYLVQEIHTRGHEIASHGYYHNLCNRQSIVDLKKELNNSKKLLEDITGSEICGFRAPNFSISDEVLSIIENTGYQYDSSYNSFNVNSRYGKISINGKGKRGGVYRISESFFEIPISNLRLLNCFLPLGGGGYFRLIPFRLFRAGIGAILKKNSAYIFYLHPWELDTEQPHVKNAPLSYRFRHYVNLKKSESKLVKMIKELRFCKFVTCSEYIASISR
jgi:polysaccharide deacetylase family protein (PEP-CTERM system associated)